MEAKLNLASIKSTSSQGLLSKNNYPQKETTFLLITQNLLALEKEILGIILVLNRSKTTPLPTLMGPEKLNYSKHSLAMKEIYETIGNLLSLYKQDLKISHA